MNIPSREHLVAMCENIPLGYSILEPNVKVDFENDLFWNDDKKVFEKYEADGETVSNLAKDFWCVVRKGTPNA